MRFPSTSTAPSSSSGSSADRCSASILRGRAGATRAAATLSASTVPEAAARGRRPPVRRPPARVAGAPRGSSASCSASATSPSRSATSSATAPAGGSRSTYVDEGDELRGTAGALRPRPRATACSSRAFGVLYGDSYLRFDLAGAFERLRAAGPRDPHVRAPQRGPLGQLERGASTTGSSPLREGPRRSRRRRHGPHRLRVLGARPRPGDRARFPPERPVDLAEVYSARAAAGEVAGVRGRLSASTRSAPRRASPSSRPCSPPVGPEAPGERGAGRDGEPRTRPRRPPRGRRVLVPRRDVASPQLSIVIPALNEELTITDFVALVPARARGRGGRGRDPHRRQLDRPHPGAGARRAAPVSCGSRSAGWAAPTSTPSPMCAASGS